MAKFAKLCIGLASACLVQILTAQMILADEQVHAGLHSGGIGGDQIMEIDRALLTEFIRLSRFNVQFFQQANYHQKWRAWAYPLGRELGTAASFANSIVDISERGSNLSTPTGISRSAQRKGLVSAVVGNAVSGTSSSLELVQNMWSMQRARENGLSPHDSLEFVKGSLQRTERLLVEREALLAAETSDKRLRVRQYETILLRRIRDQLIFEFRKWSINSRELAWRENTFFAIDAAQNFTNMGSSLISLHSFQYPNSAGSAALVSLAASSAATINPLFRNLVGVCVRKYQRNKLSKELPIKRPAMPEGLSLKELKELQESSDETDAKRLEEALFLSDNSEKLDDTIDREAKSIERSRQVAQQQSISGPVIGLTSVTRSLMSTIAFYKYRDEKSLANKLSFAGRISQGSGQAYALIDTPYTYVRGVLRKRHAERAGQSLSQIFEKRKDFLDKLEHQLSVQKP